MSRRRAEPDPARRQQASGLDPSLRPMGFAQDDVGAGERPAHPRLLQQQHLLSVQLQKDGSCGGDELAARQCSLFQQLAVHAEGLVGRAAFDIADVIMPRLYLYGKNP